MARGDGKATRGKTRNVGAYGPVKKMAIGGYATGTTSGGVSTNFSASGGPGTTGGSGGTTTRTSSYTPTATRTSSYSATPTSDYRSGPSGGGSATPTSDYRAPPSTRAGTSATNIAAGGVDRISSTSLSDASATAMHAQMARDASAPITRTADNSTTRTATQMAAAVGSTGYRGTAGSQQTSFGGTAPTRTVSPSTPQWSGAMDALTVMPGKVTFSPTTRQVPFAQTPTGANLLAQSKSPLTLSQARTLQSKLPAGSVVDRNPAAIDPSKYNRYPATVAGINITVGIPKSVTGTVPGPSVGKWNPSTASAVPTSDFRAPPTMSTPTQTASATPTSDYRAAPQTSRTMFSPDFRQDVLGQEATVVGNKIVDRIPETGVKEFYDRIPEETGYVSASVVNPYVGYKAPTTGFTMPQRPISRTPAPTSFAMPSRPVSPTPVPSVNVASAYPGPVFERSGRTASVSPLQSSAVIAAATAPMGGSDNGYVTPTFESRGDAGRDITTVRRRRRLLFPEDQVASDEVTSGTPAMRNGGRIDGRAKKGKTKGRYC